LRVKGEKRGGVGHPSTRKPKKRGEGSVECLWQIEERADQVYRHRGRRIGKREEKNMQIM